MNPFYYIPLISSIFVITLGILVFLKNIKSKLNLLFILFCTSISIWLFGTYRMFISKNDQESIFWDRFIYAGVVFIPIFMHHFSIVFGKIKKQGKLLFAGYIMAVIFLILSRTDYFVKGLYKYRWGCHTVAQPVHHIFLLVFWGYVVLLNYNVYRFYKTTKSSIERNQAKYVFAAFMILFAIGAFAYLPAYKIPILPFPFISGVLFSIILGYAIAKYKLLDIHFVIRKTATNITLIVLVNFLLALIYYTGMSLNTKLLFGFIASCILVTYLPHFKIKTEDAVNHILYKGRYDYLDRPEKFIENMALIPKEEDLIKDTVMVLTKDMYAERVILFTRDNITGDYIIKYKMNFNGPNDVKLAQNSKIVSLLKKHKKAFVLEEEEKVLNPKETEDIRKELEPIQSTICIPARLDSDLIGIIAMGNKTTGEMYTHVDIELLERLGVQLAITLDYKRIEAQLRKEQELTSIGIMSMEISHELRNLLQMPQTFIDLSLERRNDDEFFGDFRNMAMERMQVTSAKLDDIVYLGKEKPPNLEPNIDINTLLDKNLFANELSLKKEKIEVIKEYSKIPTIKAGKSQLTHLFNNLIINAIDAMKGKSGGKLRVRSLLTTNNISKEMKDKSDEWVRIEIKDDGTGIPDNVLNKLFTPFVTTKSLGNIERSGTGLGLSVVKKVVDAHKGYIHVHTKEGKGTTFVVDLPVDIKSNYIQQPDILKGEPWEYKK